MIFNPPSPTGKVDLEALSAAYQLAGKPMPTSAVDVVEGLRSEPKVQQVADELAQEAAGTLDDVSAYIDRAASRLTRAHATETLRRFLLPALEQAVRANTPSILAQARDDLAQAFDRIVKKLTRAARDLPERDPMNPAGAIVAGAVEAREVARAALEDLSMFAAYAPRDPRSQLGDVSRSAAALVPLVTLPPCEVEVVLSDGSPLNEHGLGGTRTVRSLTRAAEADIDSTIVDIARGRFEGVTFALADREALRDRSAALARAHMYRQAPRTA